MNNMKYKTIVKCIVNNKSSDKNLLTTSFMLESKNKIVINIK